MNSMNVKAPLLGSKVVGKDAFELRKIQQKEAHLGKVKRRKRLLFTRKRKSILKRMRRMRLLREKRAIERKILAELARRKKNIEKRCHLKRVRRKRRRARINKIRKMAVRRKKRLRKVALLSKIMQQQYQNLNTQLKRLSDKPLVKNVVKRRLVRRKVGKAPSKAKVMTASSSTITKPKRLKRKRIIFKKKSQISKEAGGQVTIKPKTSKTLSEAGGQVTIKPKTSKTLSEVGGAVTIKPKTSKTPREAGGQVIIKPKTSKRIIRKSSAVKRKKSPRNAKLSKGPSKSSTTNPLRERLPLTENKEIGILKTLTSKEKDIGAVRRFQVFDKKEKNTSDSLVVRKSSSSVELRKTSSHVLRITMFTTPNEKHKKR